MGRPPKFSYPADDDIVRLVAESQSMRRTALDLGIPPENFRLYIKRRPELAEIVYAALPPQHNYPSNKKLVELMKQHRSYKAVAAHVGVRRESLRDYIERRPDLHEAMKAELPNPLSEAEKRERHREASRRWAARNRGKDPDDPVRPQSILANLSPEERLERKRQLNREWARRQSPEKRAKWNNYNRLRRKASGADQKPVDVPPHIYSDPCSYCGGSGGTVDHIEAIHHGGINDPDNYTAACRSCNAAKGARFTLLGFLLHRLS